MTKISIFEYKLMLKHSSSFVQGAFSTPNVSLLKKIDHSCIQICCKKPSIGVLVLIHCQKDAGNFKTCFESMTQQILFFYIRVNTYHGSLAPYLLIREIIINTVYFFLMSPHKGLFLNLCLLT